jgi:hypothetical protein
MEDHVAESAVALAKVLKEIILMPRYKVIFESKEDIYGVVPRANDWVHYKCSLKAGKRLPAVSRIIGGELRLFCSAASVR